MSVILNFPEYQTQAQHLAEALSIACHSIDVHHFPDKESRITLPDIPMKHAIIYCGLEKPNDKLIELLLTVKTLQEHNCKRTSLVAPYLCYMRQDMAFHKGEAVSQDIIGQYLAELFDDIVTVDAHLHRLVLLVRRHPVAGNVLFFGGKRHHRHHGSDRFDGNDARHLVTSLRIHSFGLELPATPLGLHRSPTP